MRIKFLFPLLGLFLSCSLYQDSDLPDIFFEYHDYDILPLGRTFSDIIITEKIVSNVCSRSKFKY